MEETPQQKYERIRTLPLVISNSFRNEHQACPRKAYLAHILYLQRNPIAPSAAFFGTCIHKGAEIIARALQDGENLTESDYPLAVRGFELEFEKRFPVPTPMESAGLWKQYNPEHGAKIMEFWYQQYLPFLKEIKILDAETVLWVSMYKDKELKDLKWLFGLKIDLPYHARGMYRYIDWKSTGKYSKLEGIQPAWIESHTDSDQFNGYSFGMYKRYGELPVGDIGAILVHTSQRELYCASFPVNTNKQTILAWKKNFILDAEEIVKDYEKFKAGCGDCFRVRRSNCFVWNKRCSYYNICQAYPFEVPSLEAINLQFPEFFQNFDYVDDYLEAYASGNILIDLVKENQQSHQ